MNELEWLRFTTQKLGDDTPISYPATRLDLWICGISFEVKK